jgi:hypothetical protein
MARVTHPGPPRTPQTTKPPEPKRRGYPKGASVSHLALPPLGGLTGTRLPFPLPAAPVSWPDHPRAARRFPVTPALAARFLAPHVRLPPPLRVPSGSWVDFRKSACVLRFRPSLSVRPSSRGPLQIAGPVDRASPNQNLFSGSGESGLRTLRGSRRQRCPRSRP